MNTAVDRLHDLETTVTELREQLVKYQTGYTAFAALSKETSDALVGLSHPEAPSREFYDAFGKIREYMDVTMAKKVTALFEKVVIGRVDAWLHELDNLKALVATHNENRIRYDHYTEKVLALREARRKLHERGKAEGQKNMEKHQRNEDKLQEAKRVFDKTRTDVLQAVRGEEARLHDNLDQVLLRLGQFLSYRGREVH